MIKPGIESSGVKEHERHQCPRRRRAAPRMVAQHVTEVGCVFAEIGTDGRLSFAGAVSLVEDQVENLMNGVEPGDELAGVGRVERDLLVDQVSGGALETLLDRLVAHQQGAGDLGDSKAAERFQGQRKLVFAASAWDDSRQRSS